MGESMSAPDPQTSDHPSDRRVARFFGALGNRLLAGILFSIPLVVTYWVLSFGYGLVTGLSDPWLKAFGVDFPGAGFVITILAFIGLGFMATHVLGRRLLDRFEAFMLRIPVPPTLNFVSATPFAFTEMLRPSIVTSGLTLELNAPNPASTVISSPGIKYVELVPTNGSNLSMMSLTAPT